MIFADLPYGVTANKWDTPIDLKRLWGLLLAVAKPNAAFIFTATQPFATTLICSMPKLFRYDLVWDRETVPTGFMNANRMPLRIHEHVLVFYRLRPTYIPQMVFGVPYKATRGSAKFANFGTNYVTGATKRDCVNESGKRHPKSVLRIPRDKLVRNGSRHPTQKPVALLEWLIKTYSNPGDVILDPTMGSGTTGVACANTGRDFIGIEKELEYFKTAADRICCALQKGAA